MALNPQYDAIGQGFVQQYYALFDNPASRPTLENMYNLRNCSFYHYHQELAYLAYMHRYLHLYVDSEEHKFLLALSLIMQVETSFMTFEGVQLQGSLKIMEKLNSLMFQKIHRVLTSVDSQPMFDGGVLINVLGRLKCDDDPPHAYHQTFVLKPLGDSFFVQHDIFRLSIHDAA